jgi:hypothetical protein
MTTATMTENQHPDPAGHVVSLYLRGTIALIAVGVVLLVVGAALQKKSLIVVSMFLTALAFAPLALFGLRSNQARPVILSRINELLDR